MRSQTVAMAKPQTPVKRRCGKLGGTLTRNAQTVEVADDTPVRGRPIGARRPDHGKAIKSGPAGTGYLLCECFTVERKQSAPRFFGLRLVVDAGVGRAPAMLCARVDLDLNCLPLCRSSFSRLDGIIGGDSSGFRKGARR